MTPVILRGPSVYQTSYDLLCRLLRKVLADDVQTGCDAAGGIGSVQFRVSAALYALLLAHPLDREGRCRSCRGPGVVLGRRRRCWVHMQASYWLRQPEGFLHSWVAHEWGLADQPPPGAGAAPDRDSATRSADPDDTEVLPRVEPDLGDPPTPPLQTPGRPADVHRFGGAAGSGSRRGRGAPDSPWPRRGPTGNPSPGPGGAFLFAGGMTWQS